jgi:murein DD-endopeptidase MepM/ murein hydrolase activator NlpD
MQGIIHPGQRWRLALITVAGGLTAACSTYHPLDHGSKVPWAKADQAALTAPPGSAWRAGGAPLAASSPTDGYVVRRGDQLGKLASNLGVSVDALAEANRLKPPYRIHIGQVLRVPDGGNAIGAPATKAAKDVQVAQLAGDPAADVAPAAGPVAPAPAPGDGKVYVVQRGESLWSISQRIDVSLTQLAAANELASPYAVFPGQKLRIPDPDGVAAGILPPEQTAAHRHGAEPPPLTGRGFIWPVNGKVIGGFGRTRGGQRRDGIDIAAREGAPVLAAEAGLVAYAGEGIHGYGRLILLRHGDGYITTYAHNAVLLVEVGELVERGQVIARVGSTGDAARSMLHFELRKGRQPIDPETVLVREPTAVASTD